MYENRHCRSLHDHYTFTNIASMHCISMVLSGLKFFDLNMARLSLNYVVLPCEKFFNIKLQQQNSWSQVHPHPCLNNNKSLRVQNISRHVSGDGSLLPPHHVLELGLYEPLADQQAWPQPWVLKLLLTCQSKAHQVLERPRIRRRCHLNLILVQPKGR